jgi:hypothetical protein
LHEQVESLLRNESWFTWVNRSVKSFFGFQSPVVGVPVTPPNDMGDV